MLSYREVTALLEAHPKRPASFDHADSIEAAFDGPVRARFMEAGREAHSMGMGTSPALRNAGRRQRESIISSKNELQLAARALARAAELDPDEHAPL